MEFPEDSPSASSNPRDPTLRFRLLEILGLLAVLLGIRVCTTPGPTPNPPVSTPPSAVATHAPTVQMAPPPPRGALFTHPTPQRRWRERDNPKVYMPTGSGRVISASYGSVRTRSSGRASFHEGVDIAPTVWGGGRARDPVFSVADGEIAYINRIGGNSSYGVYVVIRHPDPLGGVYSLYSHLASVENDLRTGDQVGRGDPVGIMGHSSTLGIPRQRSHLHFELCVMLNPEFRRWYRSKDLRPDHSRYHGYNLAGLNPHLLLQRLHGREAVPFSFAEALRDTSTAWTILIRTRRRPLYFDQYPPLWHGDVGSMEGVVLEVGESGIPLSGRAATPQELASAGDGRTHVLSVDPDVLGRNGLRHVVRDGGEWRLGRNGERWLEILLYR